MGCPKKVLFLFIVVLFWLITQLYKKSLNFWGFFYRRPMKLNNLGFMTKNNYEYTISFENRKYIKKLVTLRSCNKFTDWLDKEEETGNNSSKTTNNIYDSTVGQINQASGNSRITNPQIEIQKPSKRNWLNILFWIIGILVGLITIYEFIIKSLIN